MDRAACYGSSDPGRFSPVSPHRNKQKTLSGLTECKASERTKQGGAGKFHLEAKDLPPRPFPPSCLRPTT